MKSGSPGQTKAYDHGKVEAMHFIPKALTCGKKLHSIVVSSNVEYESWKLFHWKKIDIYALTLLTYFRYL